MTAGIKSWPPPRRRGRAGDEQHGDLLDDDHIEPATLGSADAATPPRLHMLERAPSTGSTGSAPGPAQHCIARHIAHGGLVATRVMLTGTLVPAARVSFHVSRAVLTTTCHAAACTGRALAHAACRMTRFATAPRYLISGIDGSQQQQLQLLSHAGGQPSTGDNDAEANSRCSGRDRGRRRNRDPGVSPEPLSNLKGARITLRDCKHTRLRIEYCQDCVVVVSHLQSVELLLVCCQRVKLVMRHCDGLLLRELQCSGMGDFVRRHCPRFAHEIVCLRCACKPRSNGGGCY